MASPTQAPPEYRIQPGDQLDIKFFYNPELNETVVVRSDGKISLQLIDEVHASGLTPVQLDRELSRLYTPELRPEARHHRLGKSLHRPSDLRGG
jgi:protein involved in polysaccharide export with SLBB domain